MESPYIKGISKSFKNICGKKEVHVHFKGGDTIRNLLVATDRDNITQKSGVIYGCKCDRLECDEEYLGESARTFRERLRGHLRAPFPHHYTRVNNFCMVCRNAHNITRTIKEAM